MLLTSAILTLGVVGTLATPTKTVLERGTGCTVTQFSSVAAAVASCTAITIRDLSVPGGKTLDLTKVQNGTTITFEGTTTFGYSEWAGPLLSVAGTRITVTGTGTLDGQGALYWDGLGGGGGVTKPKFFAAHSLIDSRIEKIRILNAPKNSYSILTSTRLTLDSLIVDDSAGSAGKSLGHNTDAFNVGTSNYVYINNATVWNQDDCVAVNSGTNYYFSNMYCSGSHGLSIGSVGGRDDNTVKNVTFIDSQVINSANGVRIKTVQGATGLVDQITYSNIKLKNIENYGIILEQDYYDGGPSGTPTNGVPITNLKLHNITGSVQSSGMNYYIICGNGSCTNWAFDGISITGGKKNSCNYKPSGFSC